MSLNVKRFVSLLRKLSEHEIILPLLADIIEGQIQEGNIKVDSYNFRRSPYGIHYDLDKNIVIISPITIDSIMYTNFTQQLWAWVKNQTGILKDSKYAKELSKSRLGLLIGTLLYHGIHIFNRHNRGELIKHPDTKRWYLEFIFRCIYYFSDGLTTMPRNAALKLYYPYLWLVFERFESPMYHNQSLSDSKIDNILGSFFNYSKTDIYPSLAQSGLDQPSLDIYQEWIIEFSKNLKLLFYSQHMRLDQMTQDFLDNQRTGGREKEIKLINAVNVKALQDAYNIINTVDVLEKRFPAPPMRELFITSEPLAQSLFAEYVSGKTSGYEDWQKISARGLSFLG
jgi:hypothetical protein